MTRHLIAGRMGEADRKRLPKARDERLTELRLQGPNGLRYGLDAVLSRLEKLAIQPTEIGADLLVLAAHIQAADTRISRRTESPDGWTRQIRLVVPVSDPLRWYQASSVLKSAMDFLTGDQWTFGFRSRPRAHTQIVSVERPLIRAKFDTVTLFSGGLDSLIGAIDLLKSGAAPLLISHAAEGAVSQSQSDCLSGLKANFKTASFEQLRMWMSFEQDLVVGVQSEDTTRARSFLFLALAACAATGLAAHSSILVPENGLIALNVPLDKLRLGALSTRTTHPYYLARWNELLGALGIKATFANPYWNKTKREMVKGCKQKKVLADLIDSSISCSSPAKGRYLRLRQGHCGYCLPCLIRQGSLLGCDPTFYQTDIHARRLSTIRSKGVQVRAFQLAIERLSKKPELAKLLIHKPGSLRDNPDRIEEYADVYLRGMREVGKLLKHVQAGPI